MNQASLRAHPVITAFLQCTSSRRFAVVSVIGAGGVGLWLLFLAAIGFYHGMVPSDALDRMAGRYQVLRWLDESILGIPVELFYSWGSLLGGLAICAVTIHSAFRLPPPAPGSQIRPTSPDQEVIL